MTSETTKIHCPNCGTEINVSDVLRHQVEEQLTHQFREQFSGQQKQLETVRRDLDERQQQLEAQAQQQQKLVAPASPAVV
ncbi:MAG: hypothetical protein QUV07_12850 [Cyanobium sp. CZS 25K]|nr:hypothetical protein [Cyanobium sp. CZS25K]